MSSKEEILSKIKKNIRERYDKPADITDYMRYPDKLQQFISISKAVGGNVVEMKPDDDINTLVRSLFPAAKTIASNLPDVNIATINPDEVEKPQDLNRTDLAIIKGELGVAENGCIWIPQNVKEKVVYFISEELAIVLDKNEIVNTMHEAYEKIQFNDYGFGTFISGPSKTADIEQALVMGAQGARSVTVILK